MVRGTNAHDLDARDRRFDSGCAACFFRYQTSVMRHQFESKKHGVFFFFILKSWKVLRIVHGFNRTSPVNVGRHLSVPSRENDATRLCLSLI